MKIAIIREGKTPSDSRTPLTPDQCAFLRKHHQLDLVVQSSDNRCYSDQEYRDAEVPVVIEVQDGDILLGVKEVPISELIPDKTYFFFSHTIKQQEYNRDLLRAILDKNITLVDYEVLTRTDGSRVIAFGRYAGMVGAHNALWTYGRRSGSFDLARMKDLADYHYARREYLQVSWPPLRIVLTGTGRVGNGAAEVLRDMGIPELKPQEYLDASSQALGFVQLGPEHYARHREGRAFDLQEFFDHPERFESNFSDYYRRSDIFINGIYWDPKAPAFFTAEEMKEKDFNIGVIADVTCDIAPESSIPSTLQATSIDDPVFGYDPISRSAISPFQSGAIDMMTIDNLPNEIPRDASHGFGEQFVRHIVPAILDQGDIPGVLERATIAQNGQLGAYFDYLQDWIEG